MAVTRQDIVRGLEDMGLSEGDCVMVHASLSSFGEADGGADTVIDALVEIVGESGTVLMPAMSGDTPFNAETSPSGVGLVTEVFRKRDDTIRSLHPTHSIAGKGPLVKELIEGHIDQPTALGPESPWGRMAARDDSYILLLGVDQDRNTLLHCAEEAVDAPYLNTIEREYIDENGERKTKQLERYPGPHRDFIGLDPLFEMSGEMKINRIGDAVCRLMPAATMLDLTIKALQRDPAAVLCDNPRCQDCVLQRADIKRAELAEETFTLSAVIDDTGFSVDERTQALWHLTAAGVRDIEIGDEWVVKLRASSLSHSQFADELADRGMSVAVCHADVPMDSATTPDDAEWALGEVIERIGPLEPTYLKLPGYSDEYDDYDGEIAFHTAVELVATMARKAKEEGFRLLVENAPGTVCESGSDCDLFLEMVGYPDTVFFSFNPAHFAAIGSKPFLQTFRHSESKRRTAQLMITDGCSPPWPAYTRPGRGQGEVKELMSILRCWSFDGLFTIAPTNPQNAEHFDECARDFWRLLHNC